MKLFYNNNLYIYILNKPTAQINSSSYCSCNQDKNLTKDTDSTTIGIELCNIPQISEHCELYLHLFNVINKLLWLYQ
jgi:hypothetical protein